MPRLPTRFEISHWRQWLALADRCGTAHRPRYPDIQRAPPRRAPAKFAPSVFAVYKNAWRKSAPCRSEPLKSAANTPTMFAPEKLLFRRSARHKSRSSISAPANFDPENSPGAKNRPRRSSPVRSDPGHFRWPAPARSHSPTVVLQSGTARPSAKGPTPPQKAAAAKMKARKRDGNISRDLYRLAEAWVGPVARPTSRPDA